MLGEIAQKETIPIHMIPKVGAQNMSMTFQTLEF